MMNAVNPRRERIRDVVFYGISNSNYKLKKFKGELVLRWIGYRAIRDAHRKPNDDCSDTIDNVVYLSWDQTFGRT